MVWRWLPLVLLVASACSGPGAADPSPPPSAVPVEGVIVPPGPVLFEPEQLIFPPEVFPLAAEVSRDAPLVVRAWERQFTTSASPDFRWFTVRLYVLDPDVASSGFVAENGCGSVTWTGERPTAKELVAPPAGDGARACGYGFGDGSRVLYYATAYRNVGLLVATQPRRDAVTDALALDWLAAIAREQIAIIGGVLVKVPPPGFPIGDIQRQTDVGGYVAP